MRKRSLLATFAVAAAIVAGACGGSTGSNVTGATLLIGDYQDADSLNPFFYSTVMSSNIVGATHDGLLRLNEKLELEPWMAEEAPSKANGGIQVPGVGGDAATVTWKLRAWKWSDGVDLTCADYQFAREWIMDPKNTAVSKVGTEDISSIDCNGNTMVVHYSKIYQNLKYGPAVAPKHYYSKFTVGSVVGGNPATDVSNDMLLGAGYRTKDLPNVPTSGAFKYESRTTGVETVIVRNPYWKDPRNGKQAKLARLKYVVCGSPATCVAKFRAGELDMVTDLDGSQYAPTKDLGDEQRTLPAFTVEFLRPNFSTTVCSDGAPAEADVDGVLPTRAARGGGCPPSTSASAGAPSEQTVVEKFGRRNSTVNAGSVRCSSPRSLVGAYWLPSRSVTMSSSPARNFATQVAGEPHTTYLSRASLACLPLRGSFQYGFRTITVSTPVVRLSYLNAPLVGTFGRSLVR